MGDKEPRWRDRGGLRSRHLFHEKIEGLDAMARALEGYASDVGQEQFATLIATCDLQQRLYIIEKIKMNIEHLQVLHDRFEEAIGRDREGI